MSGQKFRIKLSFLSEVLFIYLQLFFRTRKIIKVTIYSIIEFSFPPVRLIDRGSRRILSANINNRFERGIIPNKDISIRQTDLVTKVIIAQRFASETMFTLALFYRYRASYRWRRWRCERIEKGLKMEHSLWTFIFVHQWCVNKRSPRKPSENDPFPFPSPFSLSASYSILAIPGRGKKIRITIDSINSNRKIQLTFQRLVQRCLVVDCVCPADLGEVPLDFGEEVGHSFRDGCAHDRVWNTRNVSILLEITPPPPSLWPNNTPSAIEPRIPQEAGEASSSKIRVVLDSARGEGERWRRISPYFAHCASRDR